MPGDTKTHLARLAQRKRRSKGDLNGARLRLWSALEAAEACLQDAAAAGDRDGVLKACHAVTQTAGAYARIFEVGELEARLAELEAARAVQKTPPRGGAGSGSGAPPAYSPARA